MDKWAHEELGIPLNEAASFFTRIRTPRVDVTKTAEAIKLAADKSDDELKEEGRKRGVTALAAEATREKGRKGERMGGLIGRAAGAAAGAGAGYAAGSGLSKGGRLASAAIGGLAGSSLGKHVGSEVGAERDIKHNSPKFTPISKLGGLAEKTAAMRMQLALLKLADDGSMMAPTGEQDQGAMSPPPPAQELAPQNYLQAELMGQQAQEAQEQQFYRDQLKSQQQQTQQLNQQVQQMQQQLQQTQQQADQAQQQISQATQQAVQAQDQATQQAQEAANARISAQRMRAQILDLVSKDPSMFSIEQQAQPATDQPVDANGQPVPPEGQPPDAGNGAPAQEGPAAAAPAPNTAPGAEPPAGAPDMNAPAGPPPGPNPAGAEGTTSQQNIEGTPEKTSADWRFYQMLAAGAGHRPFDGSPAGRAGEGKTASVALPLLGAGLGAAGGVAGSLMAGRNVAGLQQRVQELEESQDGGFRKALALASARKALVGGQLAQEHPVASAALGGLGGALSGSVMLPSVVHSGRGIVSKLKDRFGS